MSDTVIPTEVFDAMIHKIRRAFEQPHNSAATKMGQIAVEILSEYSQTKLDEEAGRSISPIHENPGK